MYVCDVCSNKYEEFMKGGVYFLLFGKGVTILYKRNDSKLIFLQTHWGLIILTTFYGRTLVIE